MQLYVNGNTGSSRSSLIWVCTVCPDLSVQKLRVITVSNFLVGIYYVVHIFICNPTTCLNEANETVLQTAFFQLTLHFIYRKVPKFSAARKLCCNLPYFQTKSPNCRVFSQENANGIANSEDPDQTPPLGAV